MESNMHAAPAPAPHPRLAPASAASTHTVHRIHKFSVRSFIPATYSVIQMYPLIGHQMKYYLYCTFRTMHHFLFLQFERRVIILNYKKLFMRRKVILG